MPMTLGTFKLNAPPIKHLFCTKNSKWISKLSYNNIPVKYITT